MTVEKFKKGFELASTVLVTGAAALLIWTQVQDRWLRPTLIPQPQAVTGLRIDGDRIRNVRGDGDLALVEFTDYECPFCKRHAQTTAVDISREFVTNGLIRHVVFNFPMEQIHARARQAGEAAECAARQGRYWEMHERLSWA